MNSFKDMEVHQVWAYIVTILVAGLIVIVSIASYYGNIDDERMQSLLDNGQDPLELSCLFRFGEDMKLLCSSLFHARGNEIEKGEQ